MVATWDEVLEVCRSFPMSIVLPFMVLATLSGGVGASHEFDVFRMYQYELHGKSFGCHGSQVHMEARSSEASQLHRRCVVVHLRNLTDESFADLVQRGAGALLVIMPVRLDSPSQAQQWNSLEQQLLTDEVSIPVYFTEETPQILRLHDNIANMVTSEKTASVTETLLGVFTAQGYQMVVTPGESKAVKESPITTLVGKLAGRNDEQQLPTLAVVAHYDAHAVTPNLAFGGDSNGSGVVALLELARLFSLLYADPRTKAPFNLLFVLTGGGKYDFQGTRHWIDTVLESEGNMLTNAHYVLCLDSIGRGDGVFLHVSKPPKEGSPAHSLVKSLKEIAESMSVDFSLVHKKINLADERSAWEHERFSIRRIPAATISHYASYQDAKERHTVYDRRNGVDVDIIQRNIHVFAEGIARHIYNLSSEGIEGTSRVFNKSQDVDSELLTSWFNHFTSLPRAQPLIGRDHPVLSSLEQQLSRSCPTTRHVSKPDKRDPDYIFHSPSKFVMTAHSIKPGVFDLVLGFAVAGYLLFLYGVVQAFPYATSCLYRFVGKSKRT